MSALETANRAHRVRVIEIDTLEKQQTEKIETEMKDVNRIQIRKV
jgi:hypothetical protein